MQSLTAAPRDKFTAAQVTALLVAPDLQVDFGVELLDASLNLVSDISADVVGGVVHRDNLAAVHGTVDLSISRQLAWGRDRVRPFMLLSSATALTIPHYGDLFPANFPATFSGDGGWTEVPKVRFNLGVYLLMTPATPLAETPITYAVTGYDQLHLLQDNIGDSYSVAAGANVLAAVRAVLTAAGITAPVLLDSSASASVLASALTWPLTSSSSPTWLQVVNGLFAAINYRGIWCDQDGAFRGTPYVNPAARLVEWTFNVGDLTSGIVATDRSVVSDLWNAPNFWRFVQNGLTVAPVEGTGQYTVQNVSTGLSSQASVGRTVHAPVVYLDAVDQTSLVAQGDALVSTAKRTTEVLTLKVSPMPIFWHFDISIYSDVALGSDRKTQTRSWALPLDGSDADVILESVS